MNEGKELWKKYCGFFDKSFSEQVKYREKKKEEYFEKWKNTKMAKQLCPEGVEKFEDIPITTYKDYPILREFGKKVEHLSSTVPRKKDELLWDYYDRIGKQATSVLEGWMADEYALCAKTTGTTGESKWFVFGKTFEENASMDFMSGLVLMCSDRWGETRLRHGDRMLNNLAPAPHMAAAGARTWGNEVEFVPPIEITDNITDMRKKIATTIKMVKAGERIDLADGIASFLRMICEYFKRPDELYKDYYQSMNWGMAKLLLYFIYLRYKLLYKKPKEITDVLPLKGVGTGGTDAKLYLNYLKSNFEIEPLQGYVCTELGMPMLGFPGKKEYLTPLLRTNYFEFLTDDGEAKKVNEVEKGILYDLVGTPFGSLLARYRMGDLFKVIDFLDNGLPVFECVGRKETLLDFFNYFRLSESTITEAIIKAGIPFSDRWCIYKLMEPGERICVLMEREWECTEKEAEKRIFDALKEVLPDFQNYVRDFKVKDPSKIIKVEYLRKGAFMRYTMKRTKEGVPYGQIKFPRVIPMDKSEMTSLLKSV